MSILESRPPFSECVIELTDKEADSGMRLRAIGGLPWATLDHGSRGARTVGKSSEGARHGLKSITRSPYLCTIMGYFRRLDRNGEFGRLRSKTAARQQRSCAPHRAGRLTPHLYVRAVVPLERVRPPQSERSGSSARCLHIE